MKDHLIDKFAELFSEKGEKFTVFNNTIFLLYNGMVVPFVPANMDTSLTNLQAKDLLYKLGGKLVRWNTGDFEFSGNPEWYALICRNFNTLETVSSKLRNELRKGISNCIVRRVEADYISRIGYEVYSNALSRYQNSKSKPMDEKAFSRNLWSSNKYDDILHFWGVFHKNKLIGYSSNYIFGTTEALYSSIKIDPAYLNLNPSSALIYEMNFSYLEQNKFEYVNDGYRTLMHETNFQNFLMRKFNFIKAGLTLAVYYKPIYSTIINIIYPIRKIVSQFDQRLDAVLKLESIRRSYSETCRNI